MSSRWMSLSEKQKKIGFLAVVILLQTVFLYIPQHGREVFDFFLLSADKCTTQEYFYYLFEHLAWMYVFWLMFMEIKGLRSELGWFLLIAVIDFVDYLLTYNSTWVMISDVPISWNTIQILVICLIFVNAKDE